MIEINKASRAMRLVLWRVLVVLCLAVVGGLLSATLVRFSPGYGVDESELDPRLSHSSVEAIRNENRKNASLIRYYATYFAAAAHGDLGTSRSLRRPVAELLKERFPVTARSVLVGISTAWTMAFLLAILGLLFSGWLFEVSSTLLSGLLLSLPSAVIALFFVYLRAPVFLAIALVIFPKLFRFIRNLISQAYEQPHVLAARARGVGRTGIFLWHVVPYATPALLALLGISLGMAFGAAIPIEALCDSAGIGQLAWYAAINRDLPLIMNLTLIVTLVTVVSNYIADYSSRLIVSEP
ncbi:MAG TPA: ABC transporter permease [Candidatus Acidoferrum sp.]|nr:ABC transporter permease [Candidatus Acidoferrum sp.]